MTYYGNKTHVMLKDYKHLKKGERVVFTGHGRDSGYLVCLVHNGDGNIAKPLDREVATIQSLKDKVEWYSKSLKEVKEILEVGE